MQALLAFRVRCLGFLNVRAWDVGSKPFSPQSEARSYEFPLEYMVLGQGWGLLWECVSDFSTHFDRVIWVFSLAWYVELTHIVSRFVLEEFFLCVFRFSVSWEKVSYVTYVTILGQTHIFCNLEEMMKKPPSSYFDSVCCLKIHILISNIRLSC